MKKIFVIFAAALAFVCASSCKNAQEVKKSQIIEEQMPDEVKAKLDTVTNELRQLGTLPVIKKVDALALTEQDKLVKPDYLYDPEGADKLVTPFQKKNVVFVLCIDRNIAKEYGMPVDGYDAAISKLSVETNLQDIVDIIGNGNLADPENFNKLYDTAVDELGYGTTWTMASVALVEQLWFLSNNTEKYIAMFSDKDVADLTARVEKIQDALTTVALYVPDGDILINAMTPLYVLNAMTVEEFKVQIDALKNEIAAARKAILE